MADPIARSHGRVLNANADGLCQKATTPQTCDKFFTAAGYRVDVAQREWSEGPSRAESGEPRLARSRLQHATGRREYARTKGNRRAAQGGREGFEPRFHGLGYARAGSCEPQKNSRRDRREQDAAYYAQADPFGCCLRCQCERLGEWRSSPS